ncbi:methyltransferase domain-containing protein [Methylomonas koyamae]|uniref:methyltransferase domain-containing protein n=1 Tax=Methylomonas koyamae TaxID=702114 RepID=UPI0006D0CF48|nr:methyltransferase domain-containing protein [Methylomonas koyamae]
MKQYYDQAFYDSQKTGSLLSAEQYLGYLWGFHTPRSVVDLGCGAGTWLKAAADLGAEKLVGYDASGIANRIWSTPESASIRST